jgi:hypothetical protein
MLRFSWYQGLLYVLQRKQCSHECAHAPPTYPTFHCLKRWCVQPLLNQAYANGNSGGTSRPQALARPLGGVPRGVQVRGQMGERDVHADVPLVHGRLHAAVAPNFWGP